MKNKFKQLLSFGLSVLLLVTSVPINSFAVTKTPDFGANAAGDGSQTIGASATDTAFRWFHQGLRFTIVDRNLHAVSNSVDFVRENPVFSQYGNMLDTTYKFMNGKGDELTKFVDSTGRYIKEGTGGANPTDRLDIMEITVLNDYLRTEYDKFGSLKYDDGTPCYVGYELSTFTDENATQYYGEEIKKFLMLGTGTFIEGAISNGDAQIDGSLSGGTENSDNVTTDTGGNSGSKPSGGGSSGSSKPSGPSGESSNLDLTYLVSSARTAMNSTRSQCIKNGDSYSVYIQKLRATMDSYINTVDATNMSTASHKLEVKNKILDLWPSFNSLLAYADEIDAEANSKAPTTSTKKTTTNAKSSTTDLENNAYKDLINGSSKLEGINDAMIIQKCTGMGLGNASIDRVTKRIKDAGYYKEIVFKREEPKKNSNALPIIGKTLDSLFGVMTVYAAEPNYGPGMEGLSEEEQKRLEEEQKRLREERRKKEEQELKDGGFGIDSKTGDAVLPEGFESFVDKVAYTEDGTAFNGWLKYIVNWELPPEMGGGPLFQIEGRTEESNALEMIQNDYLVLVEPLVYSNYKGLSGWDSGTTIYGTLSNIVDILGLEGRPDYIIQSYGPNYAYNALKLGADFQTTDGRVYRKYEREGWTSIAELYYGYRLNGNTIDGNMMQLYTTSSFLPDDSSINTWDKENYPECDGPSPDPSEKPEESAYGDESKTFKIVKYYEQKSGDNYYPFSYYGVEENPHKVIVQNEENYKCVEYFTSTKDESYPENGLSAETYKYADQKSKYNDGQYKGNGPATVKVKSGDAEKVIHVLLRFEPIQVARVIKVYESDGNTDKVETEGVIIKDEKYTVITPDDGYNYRESTQTENYDENTPSSWADVPQDNYSTQQVITVPKKISTIYIHYIKQVASGGSKVVLAENELTHSFMLNDLTEDGSLRSLSRTFKAIASKSCSYSWRESCDKHGSHTRWCKADLTRSYTDSNYIHTVSNHEVYDKGFVYQTNETNGTNSGEASSVSGFDGNEFNPNMSFVINRSYTDKVTLYPGKNGNVAQLQDIGTLGESYIPQGQRYNNKKESDRIQWFNTFRTNYRYDTVTDPEGEWKDDGHGYGSNWPRQASFETSGKTVSNLNEAYSKSNNVNILAFLGKTGKGVDVPDTSPKPFEFGGKTFKTNLNVKQNASGNIKFYPSILMKMQMLGGSETNVYVTSENSSELLDVRRAEVGVYKTSAKPTLELSSYQWSSHFKSLDMLHSKGISDTKSVLPGGAAYELRTSDNGEASEVWIGFKTYTTCVEDGTVGKLADTTNVLKLSTVQAENEAFKNTVKNNLEHFQIVQEVVSGVHMDNAEFDSSSPVKVSGPGQEDKFGGNTLDRSSKYYLKTDGAGADRADLDILSEAGKQIVWKLTADEEGNVTVYKDGVKIKSISRIQGEGIFLSDPELKNLNDKTKVITNFIKSLDRNKGSDRNSDKWYNEGFDSILVVENGFSFKVGFGGTHPIRGSVLDTKLCGKLDSRSDLYNYEETDKIRTSVFRTSDRSTSAVAGKAPGYVGTIHGLDVSIPSMKYLFTSKFFLIPNATVTDLN